ncbi:hypothetical protein EJ02DRAFT_457966 [Clathrospora elynae]|uniref:Uncharacterized protein n=1 Tax=Clathrospora elynae TaxID=706981 RepID=A0A6A5SCK3_9PLEO|nr:hypothetical protein EJ02DRAFT_457966 [Clathrospora elynae]
MPSKQPPAFGSQAHWDHRFTSNTDPFEWLEAPNVLDAYIVATLRTTNDEEPELL